ncbi:hypothetical protein [Burkholderia cepacia]|uniref:hypothetical protein n=1 Tax=Burkholderia cepacia TaxID=292 RepID=UPI002AB73F64|nr:hypothetical protein [Burkholderia cepacia]
MDIAWCSPGNGQAAAPPEISAGPLQGRTVRRVCEIGCRRASRLRRRAMRRQAVPPRMPADTVALRSPAARCAVSFIEIDLRHDHVPPNSISSLFLRS